MNAYQFQTQATLPDISGLANLGLGMAQARAQRAAATGRDRASGDGGENIEGMYGAIEKFQERKTLLDAFERDIYDSAYEDFKASGETDMGKWIQDNAETISGRFTKLQAERSLTPALLSNMENDQQLYLKLADDTDYMASFSFSNEGGSIGIYGVRKDGTIGFGGLSEMAQVWTNTQTIPHINRFAEMVGNMFPTKYKRGLGREQLEKNLNDRQQLLITESGPNALGGNTQVASNLNSLLSFVNSGLGSLSQEGQLSFLDEALSAAHQSGIADPANPDKIVGVEYLLPKTTFEYTGGQALNDPGFIVQKEVLDKDGNTVFINVLEQPGEAMLEMARRTGVSLAGGREVITRSTTANLQNLGGGTGRDNNIGAGPFSEIISGLHPARQTVFAFGAETKDILPNLEQAGIFEGPNESLREEGAMIIKNFFSDPKNKELYDARDRETVGRLANLLDVAIARHGGTDRNLIGMGRIRNEFAAAQIGRKGPLSLFRRESETPLRPQEVLMNVITGQKVYEYSLSGDVKLNLQEFFAGGLSPTEQIRISGAENTTAGSLSLNNNLPVIISSIAYGPAHFKDERGEPVVAPSVLGHAIVPKDMLKNIEMYYMEGGQRKKVSARLLKNSLTPVSWKDIGGTGNAQLDEQVRRTLGRISGPIDTDKEGEENFYLVPIIIPVENWQDFDRQYVIERNLRFQKRQHQNDASIADEREAWITGVSFNNAYKTTPPLTK